VLIVYFVWTEMIVASMSIARFVGVILVSSARPIFSRLTILIWEARQLNSARIV
jgi:hypothetical protein